MNNLNIIFDTNIYRGLTYGLNRIEVIECFEQIKRAETARDLIGVLTAVTAMELLSHLANDNDLGFEQCLLAITGAGIHATREYLRFIPHITLQLQQLVFGELDPVDVHGNEVIAGLVSIISAGDPKKNIAKYNDQITEINRLVQLHKSDFISTSQRAANLVDPKSSNGQIFKNDKVQRQGLLKILKGEQPIILQARGYFDKTIKGKLHHFSKDMAEQKIAEIARCYKTALTLHVKLLERVATSGYDMTNTKKKRANTIFDIYQLFSVNDETMQGKESVFVTNEKWLKEVAIESGFSEKVIDLTTYLKVLEIALPINHR
ncbi:hypothetical protein [Dyadobacter bucti]|uniref:hypothetical protein n=1 Tax=Dyadobacter bucti TaxID=2572203 RepID=UPI003F6E4CC1